MQSSETKGLVEQIQRLFIGRTSDFAEQQEYGGYQPQRRPITLEDIADHLAHKWTIGAYVAREDDRVKFACLDVDCADDPEYAQVIAQALRGKLAARGVRLNATALEFSGNKGYHVWIFFADWVETARVAAWLRELVEDIDLPEGAHIDLFPAGALPEGGYGRLVKLPLALHRKSQKTSQVVTDLPVVEFLQSRQPLNWREVELLMKPKEVLQPPLEWTGDRSTLLPCAEYIVDNGAQEGSRNHMMFSVAVAAKRAGLNREEALDMCLKANSKFHPPLPHSNVKGKVDGAYRGAGTFDCRGAWLHEGEQPACVKTCPRYIESFGRAREI